MPTVKGCNLVAYTPQGAGKEIKAGLVPGSAVAGPYEAKMAADGFAGCA